MSDVGVGAAAGWPKGTVGIFGNLVKGDSIWSALNREHHAPLLDKVRSGLPTDFSFSEQGRPTYYLVFVADNEVGDRIVRHRYRRTLDEVPKSRRPAIDQRKGTRRLSDDSERGGEMEPYHYEARWPLYGSG